MSDETSKSPPAATDVLVATGPSEHGVSVLRCREGSIEMGELREAKSGEPLLGELVSLTPRDDHARVFDVEVLAKGPLAQHKERTSGALDAKTQNERTLGHKGPSRVTSNAYRENWDSVFPPRSSKSDLN